MSNELTTEQLAAGVRRADVALVFGALLSVFAALVAALVWTIKP